MEVFGEWYLIKGTISHPPGIAQVVCRLTSSHRQLALAFANAGSRFLPSYSFTGFCSASTATGFCFFSSPSSGASSKCSTPLSSASLTNVDKPEVVLKSCKNERFDTILRPAQIDSTHLSQQVQRSTDERWLMTHHDLQ
jgi:hypothetical protein